MESFIDTRSAAQEFRDSGDRARYPQTYCSGPVAERGVQSKIAYCNYYIAICNGCQGLCGVGNPARSRLSGGSYEACESLRSEQAPAESRLQPGLAAPRPAHPWK